MLAVRVLQHEHTLKLILPFLMRCWKLSDFLNIPACSRDFLLVLLTLNIDILSP